MGWVGLHRRHGARLGLAALALQIVLSFGHIHIGKVHLEGGVSALRAAVTFGHSGVTLAQSSKKQSPAQNSGQNPGDDDDYCPICASIFLASTSLAAQPPQLAVPLGFERVALTFDTQRGIGASHRAFFQSRAPPIA